MNKSLTKVIRYSKIYGFRRTMIKVAGRLRNPVIKIVYPELLIKREKNISLIGCGQFGFSTISFFLLKKRYNSFLECFDIDESNSNTTSRFYGYKIRYSASEIINNSLCKYIYIASNHYSHTEYAIEALKAGRTVYVEKPISVNWQQFQALLNALRGTKDQLYVGYNRPFSKAVKTVVPYLPKNKPLILGCFVIGHKIDEDHWYRDPKEGTRICGNVGHWLDLSVHLMNKRGHIPTAFEISIAYSSEKEFDDNISISITSDFNDLVNIILTGRSEPFEGINETINLQCDNLNVKIDDFRQLTLWQEDKLIRKAFKPKDVGHLAAILQPFSNAADKRDFTEVEISTVLMLSITDMVRSFEKNKTIKPMEILAKMKSLQMETV